MVFVELNTPKSVNTQKVLNQITHYIQSGYKTNEISFITKFVTNDVTWLKITNDFRKVKNRIALNQNL
jgi:hypothetical protein